MSQSIRVLKGIGPKTEKLFSKLGVETLDDLLAYYPRTYDLFREPVPVGQWRDKECQAVRARIDMPVSIKKAGSSNVTVTTVQGEGGKVSLVWFHMPFLRSTLKRGQWYVFRGRVVKKGKSWEMEQPKIYSTEEYGKLLHHMQPIYALTKGLTNQAIAKAARQALEQQPPQEECLPQAIREKYQLVGYAHAVAAVHFPGDWQQYIQARKRLAFDEFLFFVLGIRRLKSMQGEEKSAYPMKIVPDTEKIIQNLPYQLTGAQLRVWREVEEDLQKDSPMSRLIQGDVGSGKTILAYLGMVMAAKNGFQAALMAPTEVLAAQHYQGLQELLEEQGILGLQAEFLAGSQTQKEKREIYRRLRSGETSLVVGTHALIQEKVGYHKLGLVITDEQHRFGVKQREALSMRGGSPHVLVMSATPIPRTLAMIVYGDLDISVLDELPAKRLPIMNCVVGTGYREKAYRFIEKQVTGGRQAYVICPMVEESEGMEGENVLDYSKHLQAALRGHVRVGILHGRMKPREKTQVMESFARHEIDVLVSTTVVEVGVNVPNATVMMVENAERFGLAQLHQLRGRVGRGEHQSYCIFIQGSPEEETRKRLDILSQTNDGFRIAEEDLKLRGPGDLLGLRQSGMLDFRIGDIYQDSGILRQAAQAAGELLEEDPGLQAEEHRGIREKMEQTFAKRGIHTGL